MKFQRKEYGHYEAVTETEVNEEMLSFVLKELHQEIENFEDLYVFTLKDLEAILSCKDTRWDDIHISDSSNTSITALVYDLGCEYLDYNRTFTITNLSADDWDTSVQA